MSTRTSSSVHVKHPRYDVDATFRISYDADPAKHNGNYLDCATVVIETGAASVQCYATADAMRELAGLLSRMADDVDAGVLAAVRRETVEVA